MFNGRWSACRMTRKFRCLHAAPREDRAGGWEQTELAARPGQAGMTKPERQTFVRGHRPVRTRTGPIKGSEKKRDEARRGTDGT